MACPIRIVATLLLLWSSSIASAFVHATPAEAPRWGIDLTGHIHRFEGRTVALVFLGSECPIARKLISAEHGLNDLAQRLAQKRITLLGVLSEPRLSRSDATRFVQEYGVRFPVLFDGSGHLAQALQPVRVPEAFVLSPQGTVAYRGRVNDGYAALGQPRQVVRSHDLLESALAVASGQPVANPVTEPVGCTFERPALPSGDARVLPNVTFHRDVAPLLAAHCVSCHQPDQVAPFSLLTYDDAAKRAKLLAEVTSDRYMPPWLAAGQPLKFADERRLSDAEIAVFRAWADAGAPEGDPADAIPIAQAAGEGGWALGEPDLIVEMPDAFDVPAAGRDIYRAFAIPLDLPDDVYVTAIDFRPGAPSVVHHALFYLDGSGAALRRQAETNDGKPGYPGFGGPGFVPVGGLGGWAPGVTPSHLPEGVGRPLRKGWDFVLNVHYHPDGRPRTDRSRVGLYFAKHPIERSAITVPLVNRDIDIPPGEPNYVREIEFRLPRNIDLLGLMPHMHLLGTSWLVTANLPSGDTLQLVHIPRWDFRWQDQYRFAEPLLLPAGTVIRAVATYDNSAGNPNNPSDPPRRVRRGEQTTDEMCMVFFTLITDRRIGEGLFGGAGNGQPGGRLRERLQGARPRR